MNEIIALGTSSMTPTKERNHSSFMIRYRGEIILFDCGEGTQRQLRFINVSPMKIKRIFITHWHGDHVLGLPGLIQTLAGNNYKDTLEIYGPSGTKERVKRLLEIFPFDTEIDLKIREIKKDGIVFSNEFYEIIAMKLEHSIECYGYSFKEKDKRKINKIKIKKFGLKEGPILRKIKEEGSVIIDNRKITFEDIGFIEKGKKITYIVDTRLCNNAIKLAENSDILIIESTYHSSLQNKAEEYFHLTSKDAAMIAYLSKSKKLILTHFSQRYKDVNELLEEAREIFPNTVAAYDFMRIKF